MEPARRTHGNNDRCIQNIVRKSTKEQFAEFIVLLVTDTIDIIKSNK
jgi:hypothetical protein